MCRQMPCTSTMATTLPMHSPPLPTHSRPKRPCYKKFRYDRAPCESRARKRVLRRRGAAEVTAFARDALVVARVTLVLRRRVAGRWVAGASDSESTELTEDARAAVPVPTRRVVRMDFRTLGAAAGVVDDTSLSSLPELDSSTERGAVLGCARTGAVGGLAAVGAARVRDWGRLPREARGMRLGAGAAADCARVCVSKELSGLELTAPPVLALSCSSLPLSLSLPAWLDVSALMLAGGVGDAALVGCVGELGVVL